MSGLPCMPDPATARAPPLYQTTQLHAAPPNCLASSALQLWRDCAVFSYLYAQVRLHQ